MDGCKDGIGGEGWEIWGFGSLIGVGVVEWKVIFWHYWLLIKNESDRIEVLVFYFVELCLPLSLKRKNCGYLWDILKVKLFHFGKKY